MVNEGRWEKMLMIMWMIVCHDTHDISFSVFCFRDLRSRTWRFFDHVGPRPHRPT